jgi:hypothetical protein
VHVDDAVTAIGVSPFDPQVFTGFAGLAVYYVLSTYLLHLHRHILQLFLVFAVSLSQLGYLRLVFSILSP